MLYVRTETRPSKHLHNLALSQEEVNTQQNQTLNLSNPASAIMGYYLFVENARIFLYLFTTDLIHLIH